MYKLGGGGGVGGMLSVYSYRNPSNAARECVATALKICSFLGLRSSLYVRTVTFVLAWICTYDTADTISVENIGPAIAGSAGPAPPPLTVPSVRYARVRT